MKLRELSNANIIKQYEAARALRDQTRDREARHALNNWLRQLSDERERRHPTTPWSRH
jgi:hypothetical protein